MISIKIRKFKKGDERGIMRLTKLLFPSFDLSLKQWRWRHCSDKTRIIVAVDEKNDVIGHWAYIKKNFKGRGRKYKAGLTLAAMVHPQWQGKGVFSRIAEIFFKGAYKENIDFLYGFPNDTLLPIHLHFGFLYVKTYNIYKKDITGELRTKKINYIFEQKRISKGIVHNNLSSCGICLIKNAQYLNRRYFKKPRSNYLLYEITRKNKRKRTRMGYLIFKTYLRDKNKHLQLIDTKVNSRFTEDVLYDFWYFVANKKGASVLSTWKQGLGAIEDKAIEKYSFNRDEEKNFHLTIKGIRLNQNSMKILQKKPWNIKMGDTEIF